jgi:DNA topoisomerase IA
VIAEAVAADRQTDPATDLQARVIARAAWSAVCAAREIWLASDAKREPRTIIHQAFDVLGGDLRQSKRVARNRRAT